MIFSKLRSEFNSNFRGSVIRGTSRRRPSTSLHFGGRVNFLDFNFILVIWKKSIFSVEFQSISKDETDVSFLLPSKAWYFDRLERKKFVDYLTAIRQRNEKKNNLHKVYNLILLFLSRFLRSGTSHTLKIKLYLDSKVY